MALHITEDCIACGACEAECANGAIAEGDTCYVIDPTSCTECVTLHAEPACQAVCPVECCVLDPERPESEADLVARALQLHPDDDDLRRRVESGHFPSRYRSS